jgi:phosphopantetheine attachment domain protein
VENGDIKAKVIEMLNNLFPNSGIGSDVLEYVDLIDDLGMDSITFISTVVEIESIFEIIVPDDMLLMENFRNVDGILAVVESAMNEDRSRENGQENEQ